MYQKSDRRLEMNILMICGSRNPEGQTGSAMNAIGRGIAEAGGVVESICLPAININCCRQCNDDGWGICREKGECVIDDDLADIVERIRNADAVVFATPVYFSDLSESLKSFLDRLRRISINSKGTEGIDGKPAVGVCVAGGGGGGAPACCVHLERVVATCGFEVVDMIPVRRQNLEAKIPLLEATGRRIAK